MLVDVVYVRMSTLAFTIASFGYSSLQPQNVFRRLHVPRRRRPQTEDRATVRTCNDLSASVSSGRSDISLGKNPHLARVKNGSNLPGLDPMGFVISCLPRRKSAPEEKHYRQKGPNGGRWAKEAESSHVSCRSRGNLTP